MLKNVGYADHSWYLDNIDVDWAGVYGNEPCVGVPDELCGRLLGGHGEMWGEKVDASVWHKRYDIATMRKYGSHTR